MVTFSGAIGRFIVNNDEIVYQIYNPNPSWHRTDDEWPQDVAAADTSIELPGYRWRYGAQLSRV
jgi:hypothetical protein